MKHTAIFFIKVIINYTDSEKKVKVIARELSKLNVYVSLNAVV